MSVAARRTSCLVLVAAALGLVAHVQAADAPALASQRLRIVGGLASLNQFTRHEAPFWSSELQRLSGGRYSAEIVPFDRAGIRGQEMLSMIKLGTVAFGTLLLSQSSAKDRELGAPDLAGLNPDMASLRRSVAAYRPRLRELLRERHGAELLAVYTYPAQVLFCSHPVTSLSSVRGRRVRTSSVSQADWVEALGGLPVNLPFAEVVDNIKAGRIDCAITGTMSGNTVGLHEVTTHLHTMAINWGLSVFVAHGATWAALPADLKVLLERELPRLEADIWNESTRETTEGVACNVGASACTTGRRGRMTPVNTSPADDRRRREILSSTVLVRWQQRCGPGCGSMWNRLLAPATGLSAQPD